MLGRYTTGPGSDAKGYQRRLAGPEIPASQRASSKPTMP